MNITPLFSLFIALIVSAGFSAINSKAQTENSFKAQAATFFKCKSGYEFQVSGKSVRCFKATFKIYSTPRLCNTVTITSLGGSIEYFLDQDYDGIRDKCVGKFNIGPITKINAMDLVCRKGYHIEVRAGKDRCRKIIPAKTVAPVTRVQR